MWCFETINLVVLSCCEYSRALRNDSWAISTIALSLLYQHHQQAVAIFQSTELAPITNMCISVNVSFFCTESNNDC